MLSLRSWFRRGSVALLSALPFVLHAQPDGLQVDDAAAFLQSWQPADLPAELRGQLSEGRVEVEFVVDVSGRVTEANVAASTDERLNAAALTSVRAWTFDPAIRDRQPVASAMRVTVPFPLSDAARRSLLPPVEPQPLPFTAPQVKRYGRTHEPEIVPRRMLGGQVVFAFTVTAEGRAESPRILAANCAELIRPALDALALTEFTPARQGTITLPAPTQAPFEFTLFGESRAARLAANGISPADADDWSAYDALPEPRAYADPVYPRDALLAAQAGEAEVHFTVSRAGTVRDVEIVSASAPEFGHALAAVLPHWAFTPAQRDGEGWAESRLALRHVFTPPASAASTAEQPDARLAALLGPDGPGISTAKGLDQGLRPLFQVSVIPPADLAAAPGNATIEFIIDREGRARLPRIRDASSPAFGWAAATAVAQWLFERPTRDGQPVDVRVAVPVTFAP